jgi:hypothetical protein
MRIAAFGLFAVISYLALTTSTYGGSTSPNNLSVNVISDSEIDLTWNDRSADELGFRVLRSEDGATFAGVADLPANTQTYKDKGLKAKTRYWYKVTGFQPNTSGTISATTPAAANPNPEPPSDQPLIVDGKSGQNYSGLHLAVPSGPCIVIRNSTNITVKQSDIGPCGVDKSTSEAYAIKVTGGSGINIFDNYIHNENQASDCKNVHENITLRDTSNIAIAGNVIAYGGEKNILGYHVSDVSVTGNFLLNPRGPANCANPDNLGGNQAQFWADAPQVNERITVNDNYGISSTDTEKYLYAGNVSDAFGFGHTNGVTANNNYVTGGHYDKACGLIADYQTNNVTMENNVIWDTFNCGIGLGSGGSHQKASGNKILLTNPPATTGHAGGLVVTNYYPSIPCDDIAISNNVAYAKQSNGYVSSYYDQGVCTNVQLSNNVFDSGSQHAAYDQLNPMTTTNPPPLIPPGPHECVARSPYTTQTSKPAC